MLFVEVDSQEIQRNIVSLDTLAMMHTKVIQVMLPRVTVLKMLLLSSLGTCVWQAEEMDLALEG